jgi:ankyrin repeat protein
LWAAEKGHEPVVKLLLEKGADVGVQRHKLWPDAAVAGCRQRERGGGEAADREGADRESKSHYGWTPLSRATGNEHEAVVRLLVEKGADVESKGHKPWAAWNGHEAGMKPLLEKGADVESKDRLGGRTPLSWAAAKGYEAAVKLLLEKGADVESKDGVGQTPLSRAARDGHKAVVKLLLEKSAEKLLH